MLTPRRWSTTRGTTAAKTRSWCHRRSAAAAARCPARGERKPRWSPVAQSSCSTARPGGWKSATAAGTPARRGADHANPTPAKAATRTCRRRRDRRPLSRTRKCPRRTDRPHRGTPTRLEPRPGGSAWPKLCPGQSSPRPKPRPGKSTPPKPRPASGIPANSVTRNWRPSGDWPESSLPAALHPAPLPNRTSASRENARPTQKGNPTLPGGRPPCFQPGASAKSHGWLFTAPVDNSLAVRGPVDNFAHGRGRAARVRCSKPGGEATKGYGY